jgi:hypothetical protein
LATFLSDIRARHSRATARSGAREKKSRTDLMAHQLTRVTRVTSPCPPPLARRGPRSA